MSRLFISHSSKNDDWAIALKDWLVREGWSGADDIFLDLDPDRGITAGQRWAHALEEAATRCEAVLFLISEDWLDSKWCSDEYHLASRLNKKLFALVIDDLDVDRLPGGMTSQWQVVWLQGEPSELFVTVHPLTGRQLSIRIAIASLRSLKRGLEKAGIGTASFELQPDPSGPFGWRAPYRGLEAFEPEDAAVFFGRSADIVRGIDTLRGLAMRKPPRLLVVLGASGAGKSSFLRAGLWPRMLRDDSRWLPLRAIRTGRGGAIEGSEGLLTALEEVHRRFALHTTRTDLCNRLTTTESFIALLIELRQAAAKRALITELPMPVLCLDQGEELFAASAPPEAARLMTLARAAIEADAALLLVTIRSDFYGAMQSAEALAGIDQTPVSLGPVQHGEVAHVIREPAEILRRKVGPAAPLFDAAVIERLQQEIQGEDDALPLLAFVLQRLMREHQGISGIGIAELERTGGVAAAIESAAQMALDEAGFGQDRSRQREALRRLFIPSLARIDRESKAPQRRVTRQSEIPDDLLPLAQALTQRRLLVVKVLTQSGDEATIEVAHEALLRRWPTLADLLAEDRDALLLLDGLLSAAADWEKAPAPQKPDFLAHRGSRLSEAQALPARGSDWARQIAPAQGYLSACAERETAERQEKEAALAREQQRLAEIAAAQQEISAGQARTAQTQRRARRSLVALAAVVLIGLVLGGWEYATNRGLQASLKVGTLNLLSEASAVESLHNDFDGALRLSLLANDPTGAALADAVSQAAWTLNLNGHSDWVMHATFSPDGGRIVTASNDKTARIWDAHSGSQLMVLSGHGDQVMWAVFSPDGARVLTASKDGTARLWDAATGKQITVLQGHGDWVMSAAFNADGTRIVTASKDKTARVWDAASGDTLLVLSGHGGMVTSAAYSPDGKRIVTTSADNTARIWDADSGTLAFDLEGHKATVWSGAFSPDGTRIVTASDDNTARLWDATSGKSLQVLESHEDWVRSAAFSPDGTQIVTASYDNTVRLWKAESGAETKVLRGHEAYVESAAYSPDGTRIVTSSDDNTARVWDVAKADDAMVLKGHEDVVTSAAFSPDGMQIITSSYDGTARFWDAATGEEIPPNLAGSGAYLFTAAFSPDGTQVVTASYDKTARVWDVKTRAERLVLSGHEGYVEAAAYSPDGSRIVTASDDDTARVWDANTGQQIMVLRGHDSYLDSAAYSPDGTRIVTASDDGTARIWDAGTGKQLTVLRGHEGYVEAAVFSPDGARVVTGSYDRTARVWDAATGRTIMILRGHQDTVRGAAFSPDGTQIVTASADQTVRLWDAKTGNAIAVLRGHTKLVESAAYSSDGTKIVTASDDQTARVWDARVKARSEAELRADACTRRLGRLTNLTREEMHLAGHPDSASLIDVCRSSP